MSRLYELTADYRNLLVAIESGDIPDEAIADTLESIEAAVEEKADNIACLIKNLTADAEAIKAEEDRLKERRTRKLKRAERLTNYLSDQLQQAGCDEIETPRNRIFFRKNPPKVVIDNEAAFIEWASKHADDLLNYGKPTVNRTAVKEAIDGGADVVGARMESSVNIQIK